MLRGALQGYSNTMLVRVTESYSSYSSYRLQQLQWLHGYSGYSCYSSYSSSKLQLQQIHIQWGQSTANARIQLLFMRLHAMQATCNNDVYHNKSSSIKQRGQTHQTQPRHQCRLPIGSMHCRCAGSTSKKTRVYHEPPRTYLTLDI